MLGLEAVLPEIISAPPWGSLQERLHLLNIGATATPGGGHQNLLTSLHKMFAFAASITEIGFHTCLLFQVDVWALEVRAAGRLSVSSHHGDREFLMLQILQA